MNAKPQRQFKGVWIPAIIWDHKDLTWLEKCILAEIDALTSDERPCTASDEYLGEMFGIKRASMANKLSDLRKRNFIETVSFDGVRRILKVKDPFTISMKPPFTDSVKPPFTELVKPPFTDSMKGSISQVVDGETLSGDISDLGTSRGTRGGTSNTENTGAGRALASRKKRAEPTPEARELVHLFAQAYLAHTGVPYGVQEKDSKFAAMLLAMSNQGVAKTTEVVVKAWKNGGWWGKRVKTIKGFAEHWNEIQAEVALGPVAEVPPHVEARRLREKLARHPANREWIGYRAESVTPAQREEYRALKAKLMNLEDTEQ